jgi:cytoskeletal protein CcmA (bactofilin family)
MKIALAALFAATVATSTGSAFAQDLAPQPAELVPAGVPLRVELDKSYQMKVGTPIEGHLTESIYLIDHVAVPADSKVFGTITAKHSVSRQVRTAAMFNGDMTPLKNADVTFSRLETPDGRQFAIATDATERTAKVVRMLTPEQTPHRSLGQRIAAAFRWTKRETGAAFSSPHKLDTAKQALYAQIPLHPQELWAGTQYDAELKQPLELTGQTAPAPAPAADLSELKLTGDLEARLVDPVDSATATPGMPVEAVLTQPLFENDPAVPVEVADATTPAAAHGKLLLPEGTHLIGSVVEAKPAGMWGHNGSLRLTFRKAELPAGDERVVHGRVIGAESVRSDRVQIDNEGQIKANGSSRFLAPITLGSLAAVSDNTGAGLIKEAMTSNGLDLLTRVIGTASANAGLISGFAYYEVGKVVFDTWVARGHEVVFAKNTRLEIELAQR